MRNSLCPPNAPPNSLAGISGASTSSKCHEKVSCKAAVSCCRVPRRPGGRDSRGFCIPGSWQRWVLSTKGPCSFPEAQASSRGGRMLLGSSCGIPMRSPCGSCPPHTPAEKGPPFTAAPHGGQCVGGGHAQPLCGSCLCTMNYSLCCKMPGAAMGRGTA